jgi:cell wall assembly regulator SMI1
MTVTSMIDQWIATNSGARTTGATDQDLDAAAAALGIDFPSDYRAVMGSANGGDAEFGESWIVMWRVEDLAEQTPVARSKSLRPASPSSEAMVPARPMRGIGGQHGRPTTL